MIANTIYRARNIVNTRGVKPVSYGPGYMAFHVMRRNGEWADVWLDRTEQGDVWKCNVTVLLPGGIVGCAYKGENERPFCSHSLAAWLFLKGWDLQW